MVAKETPRRRGRPPGSVGLTAEMEDKVLTLVRGGASLRSAAVAAGIPVRTLQGWVARGAGRSKEPATPKLRRFAKAVDQVQAEARVSAEVRLHQSQPGRWLHDGISGDPGGDESLDEESLDPHAVRELARKVRDALLLLDASELVPACLNKRCRCMFHRQRTTEELSEFRDMISKGAVT